MPSDASSFVNSLPVPTYGVVLTVPDVDLSVGSVQVGKVSSMVIAESRVSLTFRHPDDGIEKVLSLDYRGVVVHGVSSADPDAKGGASGRDAASTSRSVCGGKRKRERGGSVEAVTRMQKRAAG